MEGPAENASEAARSPDLRRSRTNRVIAGVAGGLGEYLNLDPVLIRVAFVVLAFLGGPGILLYLVAWIVIPEAEPGTERPRESSSQRTAVLAGAALVAIGGFMLVERILPSLNRVVWPLSLVLVGVLLLYQGSRR